MNAHGAKAAERKTDGSAASQRRAAGSDGSVSRGSDAVHGSIRPAAPVAQRRRRTERLCVSVSLWQECLAAFAPSRSVAMRLTLNGKRANLGRASAEASARRVARGLRAHGHEGRLRRRRVRRVHGARRRRAGQLLPGPAAQVAGARVTTIEGLERATPAAAGVRRARRRAVRHLHAGHDHGGRRARPSPTLQDMRVGLAGNLCRCTGYSAIYRSIEAAAKTKNRQGTQRAQSKEIVDHQTNDNV